MRNIWVFVLAVLLTGTYAWAGWAPVDETVDSGWTDTMAAYVGYPDPGQSGGTTLSYQDNNHWWHTRDQMNGHAVFSASAYAPFTASGQQYASNYTYVAHHNWFLLTNPVTTGTCTLTWDQAMTLYDPTPEDHFNGDEYPVYIRIYPLEGTDGYDDTPVTYWDNGLVGTLNNVGYQTTTGWSLEVPDTLIHPDQILHMSLDIDMDASTAQWIAKDDGNNTLFDTGVQTLPVTLSQISGFAFKSQSQEEVVLAQYGWTNVSYTGPGSPTPKNRGDVTEDDFVGADDLVRILTH